MQPQAWRRGRVWLLALAVDRGTEGGVDPAHATALELLQVAGGQPSARGESHFRIASVQKQNGAGEALDGGVEKLTQAGEHRRQRLPLPNQTAHYRSELGDAERCRRDCSPLWRGATSRFAMKRRHQTDTPIQCTAAVGEFIAHLPLQAHASL